MLFQPASINLPRMQAAARHDQVLKESYRLLLGDLFDETFPGVAIEGRARRHERHYLMGVARREHRRHPAALTKPDEIDATAEIIDDSVELGEIDVDIVVLHLFGRRLPIEAQQTPYAARPQRFDKALALGVIGDGRIMSGIGWIDDRRNNRRVAARGHIGKISKSQGVEIINNLVWSGPHRFELEFLLYFFSRKVEISLERFRCFFTEFDPRSQRPEERNAVLEISHSLCGKIFRHSRLRLLNWRSGSANRSALLVARGS